MITRIWLRSEGFQSLMSQRSRSCQSHVLFALRRYNRSQFTRREAFGSNRASLISKNCLDSSHVSLETCTRVCSCETGGGSLRQILNDWDLGVTTVVPRRRKQRRTRRIPMKSSNDNLQYTEDPVSLSISNQNDDHRRKSGLVDRNCDERNGPVRAQKKYKTVLVVAAALIDEASKKVLLAQRPEGKSLAGLWEYPGGKVDPGEVPEIALCRELEEEVGIHVAVQSLEPLTFASHTYEDQEFHLLMPLFVCREWEGVPTGKEGQEIAWASVEDLLSGKFDMPPADGPLLEAVIRAIQRS